MPGRIFKPASGHFANVQMLDIVDVTVTKTGSKTKMSADAAETATKGFLQNLGLMVSVRLETQDGLVAWKQGTIGPLVFQLNQQNDGQGTVIGGAKTANYPSSSSGGYALLDNVSAGIPHEGRPTMSLSFDIIESSGVASLLEELV